MQNAGTGRRVARKQGVWGLLALLTAALHVAAETPAPAPDESRTKEAVVGDRGAASPANGRASARGVGIDSGRVSVILWDEPENRGDKKPQLLNEKRAEGAAVP